MTILDKEADNWMWTDINFLTEKIYQNNFALEYKIYHPQEVLNALAAGASITL